MSRLIRLWYAATVERGSRVGKQAQIRAVPVSTTVQMAELADRKDQNSIAQRLGRLGDERERTYP